MPRRPEEPVPQIWTPLLAGFQRYLRGYLARHVHAVRRSRTGSAPPRVSPEEPLVVYANHPSWWDPLIFLFLSDRFWPERSHYGPIDAEAARRYKFFRRLGFFGVEQGTRAGARTFLETSSAILERPSTALWITPQGDFTDPRNRPVRLEPGLVALARRLERGTFVPLALELPFWQEKLPEVLVRFGEPVSLRGPEAEALRSRGDEGRELLARRLEDTQDALALEARARRETAFDTLLSGAAGPGGVYDLWRRAKAWIRRERFEPEHGSVQATRQRENPS